MPNRGLLILTINHMIINHLILNNIAVKNYTLALGPTFLHTLRDLRTS